MAVQLIRTIRAAWAPAAAALLLAAAVLGAVALRPLLAAAGPQRPALQTLRVGVPEGALRYANGLRDYTGDGLEPAFAQDLAAALVATLQLVPLAPGSAGQALQEGRIDVALDRLGAAGDPGGAVVRLPAGLRSGVSAALRSDTTVRRWSDLAGQVLCATRSQIRAHAAVTQAHAQLRAFDAPAQALVAVRTGECAAAVIDRIQLEALLQRAEWRKFSTMLPPVQEAELSVLAHPDLAPLLRQAVRGLDSAAQWQQRAQQWAANVAFEVYFDQTGPDCH